VIVVLAGKRMMVTPTVRITITTVIVITFKDGKQQQENGKEEDKMTF